jgi:CRISPR-associated protein Csx10
VELLEPLLIANPISGDENSAEGLEFIPGSVVRGALAQAYTDGKRGDIGDPDFARLFFGDICFLNAYLKFENARSLPTPRSWQSDKNDATPWDPCKEDKNSKLTSIMDFANTAPADGQYKGMESAFVDLDSPTAVLSRPKRLINVHIFQPDRVNATEKGQSAIFRYDALAAGQTFAGAILSEREDDLDELQKLLEKAPSKLGKSRSAGYGAVRFGNGSIKSNWAETPPAMQEPGTSRVVVTLLSDVILRDKKTGAFSSSLDGAFAAPAQKSFARVCVVGGFNLAWGLPLPQAQAIQKGSVFVFERTDALMEKLLKASERGVGERVVDGFGRVAIDWHTSARLDGCQFEDQPTAPKEIHLAEGSPARALAQKMADKIWREELDGLLRNAIGEAKLERPPRNTQLARIRVLARDAWQQNNAGLLAEALKEPDKEGKNKQAMKNHARQQFMNARVSQRGYEPLINWLSGLANDPSRVWQKIGADRGNVPVIGGATAQNPSALEYTARLIDGVLRKTALSEEQN